MPSVEPQIKPKAVLEDYAQILKTTFKATDNFCLRIRPKPSCRTPWGTAAFSVFLLFVFSAASFLILRQ